jgi:hypothetical protein
MTTDISDQTDAAAESRQEAAWARMEELARRASEAASAQALAPKGAERKRPRRPRRRPRVVVTTVAVLVAATAAGALVVARDVHGRAPTSAPALHSATAVDVVRLEAATTDALAAVMAEREGLAHLAGIPTPANVAPVTDAYAASLRLYGTLLTTTRVPAGAESEAQAAHRQVGADATRLQGVAALPPLLLGALLADTTARAMRLEGVLRTLQHDLAVPAAR